MSIVVIIPAFNEEKAIASTISNLSHSRLGVDIVVVNDGSRDNTALVAKKTNSAHVVTLPVNLGIGGAVQTGFLYAKRNGYDIAIQFDGDGQHKASEIPALIAPILEGKADAVIGSRFIGGKSEFLSTKSRRVGIKIFELVNSLLIRQRITDNTSGFRAYNKKAIALLADHYPDDYPEPEAVILLGRHGLTIAEVPVAMQERQGGVSSIAGLKSLYYMIKVLFAVFIDAMRPQKKS